MFPSHIKGGTFLHDGFAAELGSDLTEVDRVGRLIEEFGERTGLPPKLIYHFTLAFDELLTNTISYGFPDGMHEAITVSVTLDDESLVAEILDSGIAFNPLERDTPDITLSVEDRPIGGLGIHFVRTFMDKVEYCREDGRNRLTMAKYLKDSA
jgi:anti-sigma regulatory factor (Ser/Thr protein kinase)